MIYFIVAEETNSVKIGYTGGDPLDRLSDLQTGNHHKLSLIATAEGDRDFEKRLHERFASDRVQGEWFKLSTRLVVYICKLYALEQNRKLWEIAEDHQTVIEDHQQWIGELEVKLTALMNVMPARSLAEAVDEWTSFAGRFRNDPD